MIALLAAARRVRMALTAKAKEDARATAAAVAATAAAAAIIAVAEQGATKAIAAEAAAAPRVQAGAGANVRAQAGSQVRVEREAEDRMLDQLEAQCNADDADIAALNDEAVKATCRAEQEEHRAKVVPDAHDREVRELELDAEFGRIMSGRLEGQLAAERQVRLLRKERLDATLVLDKERADRAELSIAMVWECLEREKENVEKLRIEKDALDKDNFVKQARLLADEALRHAAEIGCTRSANGAAGTGATPATMATPNMDMKEGLWLESPARTDSSAELGVSDDGTEKSGEEEEEEEKEEEKEEKPPRGSVAVVGGGVPATATEQQLERQQSAKESEIRQRFLESRRQRFWGVTEFDPAVSLPVQCSLSPMSNSLQRGPLLSKGQFGAVTLVRHAFGRFALKEVAPGASQGARDAAKHEMRVLLSLKSHPHVITLKGFDDTIPSMPILLELAVCDAFDILENGHCHSMLQKTSLLRDAASGLLHIHSKGWVHVDFKAENLLMVKGNGRLLQGKVSDFGLARLEGDVRPKMTGTPGYIPMENLTEAVATSSDQDVFSLAVLMLMMFVLPHLQGNNVFALEVLLTDAELDELNWMEEGDLAADIAFDSRVMQRTSVDGSFETEILKASNLQDNVPLAEEVCEWLKACLSSDVSARLSMPDLASNLNRLVQRSRTAR